MCAAKQYSVWLCSYPVQCSCLYLLQASGLLHYTTHSVHFHFLTKFFSQKIMYHTLRLAHKVPVFSFVCVCGLFYVSMQ